MATRHSATLLLFSLSFAFLAAIVAARIPHGDGHGISAGTTTLIKLKGHDDKELEFELVRMDMGLEFQICVMMDGVKMYLYSEGEKVEATHNPDSVGVERTIWMVVMGITPGSMDYSGAVSIQNKDTGARLYYDAEKKTFYGAWIEGNGSPVSGWRMWQSMSDPSLFKMENVPAGGKFVDFPGNDMPKMFMFKFMSMEKEHDARRSSTAAAANLMKKNENDKEFMLLNLEVGTQFQIGMKVEGDMKYLYAEGKQVMATSDIEKVGMWKTMWMVVPSVAPERKPYRNAMAIQNMDSGAHLYYDAEKECFYAKFVEGNAAPMASWRVFQSMSNSEHFKMQNVPAGGMFVDYPGNEKPGVFYIMFHNMRHEKA